MKLLKDILYRAGLDEIVGSTNIAVDHVTFDSRNVEKFTLFVAVKGTQVDGHDYIEQVIQMGAVAIVCENLPENIDPKVTYVKVQNTSQALGFIGANFYDTPSAKLKLVGITGTNGKTTTATLLYKLFRGMGYKVGLLSTVGNKIDNVDVPSTHTTPDALALNKLLSDMVQKGCTYCFMEVSSHAVIQNRIAGLDFAGGIFSNITHDHLDYHKTFDAYITAKKKFFDGLSADAFALVNKDDPNGVVMTQNTKARVYTYALRTMADFKCKILENQFEGLLLNIDGQEVWTKLIGGFNAYNVLTVYTAANILGEDKMSILTTISNLSSVAGRFEYIKSENNITGIVDYAHTPDALINVLKTINEIRTGDERVITVIGCGGDRDVTKRPLMADVACKNSDHVIFTSDNPRSENPDKIIEDMLKGVQPVHIRKTLAIPGRKEAIKTACSLAQQGDIILLAGKGHEKYQEINGERLPFDDLKVLKEMFEIVF